MGIDVQVLTKKQRSQIESKLAAENIQPASVLGKTWSGPNDSTPQLVLHRADVSIITDQTLKMRDVEILQEGGEDWVVPGVRGISVLYALDKIGAERFHTQYEAWVLSKGACHFIQRQLQLPDCLQLVQDEALMVITEYTDEEKKAGKKPTTISILHFSVQPRYAVPLKDFTEAFQQLLDTNSFCVEWRAAADFDFLSRSFPPPANKQMDVCLAALEHLIQSHSSRAVAYKAALAYQHMRGGLLSFKEVLADSASSRALADALDIYPEQTDGMVNDIALSTKHQLANNLGCGVSQQKGLCQIRCKV